MGLSIDQRPGYASKLLASFQQYFGWITCFVSAAGKLVKMWLLVLFKRAPETNGVSTNIQSVIYEGISQIYYTQEL